MPSPIKEGAFFVCESSLVALATKEHNNDTSLRSGVGEERDELNGSPRQKRSLAPLGRLTWGRK